MKPQSKNAVALLPAPATVVLTLVASVMLLGQSQPPPATPTSPTINRNLVVLDPAHGGPDAGATLADHAIEKDVTLALAARLRAALTGAGFTVVSTREADPTNPLTTDQRAETANRAHPVACIVLHATGTGSGVHLYTSALPPSDPADDAGVEHPPAFVPVPWEMAQAGSVQQSLGLANDLGAALASGNLRVAIGRAPLRPLDNLMCPAVAVEVAPLVGGDTTPVTDQNYQQRVAGTLAGALRVWRDRAYPPAPHAAASARDGMEGTSATLEHGKAITADVPARGGGGASARPEIEAHPAARTVDKRGGSAGARGAADVAAPEGKS